MPKSSSSSSIGSKQGDSDQKEQLGSGWTSPGDPGAIDPWTQGAAVAASGDGSGWNQGASGDGSGWSGGVGADGQETVAAGWNQTASAWGDTDNHQKDWDR